MSKQSGINEQIPRKAYSPSEISKMYGLGRSTVFDEIYKGKLAAYKVGRRTLVSAEALAIWEKNNKVISGSTL